MKKPTTPSCSPRTAVAYARYSSAGQRDVSIEQSDRQVSVRIAGHARPLPLMGLLASAALRRDGKGLVLDVSLQENLRPSWLGGDYDAWQGIWG